MITMIAAARTDPGLVRDHNEDAFAVTDVLAVVADGLGGHAAGEVASRTVVDRLASLVHPVHPDHLLAAVEDANRLLLEQQRTHPERAGMATTLTGVVRVGVDDTEQLAIVNVGDSRVYRWVGGELSRVTVDHSEVQELRDVGVLAEEEMSRYPRRNIVTRCLGSDPAPEADLWTLAPGPAERYLVCSDGLSNELTDEVVARVLAAEPDPDRAADELVFRALAAGGRDNVTVVVVDVTTDAPA